MERTRTQWHIILLRVSLTLLCVLTLVWIFSNSLRPAEESSGQSASVVEIVQETVGAIAPSSPIATATGEDYELLHSAVRTVAHFAEFTFLGALLIWCCFSYTKRAALFAIPVGLIALVPVIDELLQSFTGGRAMELKDILIDILGGLTGGAYAVCAVFIAGAWLAKRKRKREEGYGARELGNRLD